MMDYAEPAAAAASADPQPSSNPDVKRLQDAHFETVFHLRQHLPFTDAMSEAEKARMLDTAISHVGDLQPGTGLEAKLAAKFVAALSQDDICITQVNTCLADIRLAGKLRAESACMGRQARGYLNAFLSIQAKRLKRDKPDDPRESGAWSEHSSRDSLRQAAAQLPPEPVPPPRPVWTEPARPARAERRKAEPEIAPVLLRPRPELTPEQKRQRSLAIRADEYAGCIRCARG